MKIPKPRLPRSKRARLLAALSLAVVVLAAGAWYWYAYRETPEKILYAAIRDQLINDIDAVTVEESLGTAGTRASSESSATRDGHTQGSIKLACDAKSLYGEIELSLSFLLIDEKMYFRYDEVVFSGGDDEAINTHINNFYRDTINGKWVSMSAPLEPALGFKEQGVLFGMLGAWSNKLDPDDVLQRIKEYGVVTVLSSRDIRHDGKAALEYSLLVRRSTYEKFIDSIESRFRYKDAVLDSMFLDDTTEVTLVVDKTSKKASYMQYSTENICTPFIQSLDPDAAKDLPRRMEVRARNKSGGTADKIEAPTNSITEEELAELFATYTVE